jgi:hypothetical protein
VYKDWLEAPDVMTACKQKHKIEGQIDFQKWVKTKMFEAQLPGPPEGMHIFYQLSIQVDHPIMSNAVSNGP